MDDIIDIKVGQALPPEEWIAARDRLSSALPMLTDFVRLSNHSNNGEANARLFLEDARMALVAIEYVAHFATENCRYIAIPLKRGPDTQQNPAK